MLLTLSGLVSISFDLDIRNTMLLIFFSTIGLNAKVSALRRGGKALVLLVLLCGVYLVLQNAVGVSTMLVAGEPGIWGLFAGSIALAGGHGTAIAWGESAAAEAGGVAEFGIAVATFGLIAGGVLGGPLASRLINQFKLVAPDEEKFTRLETEEVTQESVKEAHFVPKLVSIDDVIGTVLALALCLGLGDAVNRYLFSFSIRLPGFLTAMAIGVVITNLADPLKLKMRHNALDLIGGVCLQLFLVMSLMSLDLLSLVSSLHLLLLVMLLQCTAVLLFTRFVVFPLMGRDYDSAVMSAGFVGIMLGATPVAVANMDAVSGKYGASAKALLVVPLVGSFFIDLLNGATLGFFTALPFM
ncbi:MAG: hypothetical protein MK135_16520 [Polyangiaceae bacterium]|nr:hypothetical protein [Polyangiaceae bacterium]